MLPISVILFAGGLMISASSLATGLQSDWSSISVSELASQLDSVSPPLMLDVRGRQAYLEGTIPGALDAGIEPSGFLPESIDGPVVLIVPDDAAADYVASWVNRLRDAGQPVLVFEDGFPAWAENGHPIVQPDVSFTKPGTVPFLIPRGLCEGGEPAQVFE